MDSYKQIIKNLEEGNIVDSSILNDIDNENLTPLMKACLCNDYDSVKGLIISGAQIKYHKKIFRCIMNASRSQNKRKILDFLFEKGLTIDLDYLFSDNLNMLDVYTRDDIHTICLNDDVEIISFLVDTFDIENKRLLKLLNTCCESASAEIILYFVSKKSGVLNNKLFENILQYIMCDVYCEQIPFYTDRKLCIIRMLCQFNQKSQSNIFKIMFKDIPCGKFQPADCYQYDSLFMFVADFYTGDDVECTLETMVLSGFDVNIDNFFKFSKNNNYDNDNVNDNHIPDGYTPLSFALSKDYKNLAKLIINKGAYLNYVNCFGLDLLAKDLEYQESLIELGMDKIPLNLYGHPYVFENYFDDVKIPDVFYDVPDQFKVKTDMKTIFPEFEESEINSEIKLQIKNNNDNIQKEFIARKKKEEDENITILKIKNILEDPIDNKIERITDMLSRKSKRRASQSVNSDFLFLPSNKNE